MKIPLPLQDTNNRFWSENSEVWHGDTLIARCPQTPQLYRPIGRDWGNDMKRISKTKIARVKKIVEEAIENDPIVIERAVNFKEALNDYVTMLSLSSHAFRQALAYLLVVWADRKPTQSDIDTAIVAGFTSHAVNPTFEKSSK